jgi:hypothetical protein
MFKSRLSLSAILLTLASAALFISAGAQAQGNNNQGAGDCAVYYAGQTIILGSVCVSVSDANLQVTYQLTSGWLLSNPHLWVGDTLASAPRSGNGNPIPGRFPYNARVSGVSSYTFSIPLTQLNINADTACGDDFTLLVAAHGEVNRNGQGESAWAGETRFSTKGNWATYFGASPDCGGGDNGPIVPEGCFAAAALVRNVGVPFNLTDQPALDVNSDSNEVFGLFNFRSRPTGLEWGVVSLGDYDVRTVSIYAVASGTDIGAASPIATWNRTPGEISVGAQDLTPYTFAESNDLLGQGIFCEAGADFEPEAS